MCPTPARSTPDLARGLGGNLLPARVVALISYHRHRNRSVRTVRNRDRVVHRTRPVSTCPVGMGIMRMAVVGLLAPPRRPQRACAGRFVCEVIMVTIYDIVAFAHPAGGSSHQPAEAVELVRARRGGRCCFSASPRSFGRVRCELQRGMRDPRRTSRERHTLPRVHIDLLRGLGVAMAANVGAPTCKRPQRRMARLRIPRINQICSARRSGCR